MPWPFYCIVFWLGAVLGSFANVVGLRFLKEESIVQPRSYCYVCQTPIRVRDNIPILSWLLLRGRCHACQAPISWQYPVIELLTALLFLATVGQFGFTWQSALLMLLIWNLMVILITDFREQYIFDINSLGLIPFGLLYSGLNLGHVTGATSWQVGPLHLDMSASLASALLAVLGSFVLFFTLNLLSRLLIGKPGFGEGDTRLLMGIGAFFGVQPMIVIFIVSFVVQAAIGIPMMLWQWWQQGAQKTALWMMGGMALAGLPYALQRLTDNGNVILGVALTCGLLAMTACMRALKRAKAQQLELTYLPFGPAIVLATLFWLFKLSV